MTDEEEYAPAIPGGRPRMRKAAAALYDEWLTPNGIEGWMPVDAIITVHDGKVIDYPQMRHLSSDSGPWDPDVMRKGDLCGPGIGMDADEYDQPLVDRRAILLKVPVTDRVRDLFRQAGILLVER